MAQQRASIMKVHAILAGFFLPLGVMFVVTGALYTWGIKGSYETESVTVALDAPIARGDQQRMHELVVRELDQRGLAHPSGGYKVKGAGTSFLFEWTGSNRDVVLQPTDDGKVAKLDFKHTTLHRRLVQLHKAKGGSLFKVMAAALTVGLLILFASGFTLAWSVPTLRRSALVGLLAGVLIFVVAVVAS